MSPRVCKTLFMAIVFFVVTAATPSALAASLAVGDVSNVPVSVPEPATIVLFGGGLIGLAGLVRRRQKR